MKNVESKRKQIQIWIRVLPVSDARREEIRVLCGYVVVRLKNLNNITHTLKYRKNVFGI